MALSVKICGINDEASMEAACDGGTDYVGLNFYPPSPRFVGDARAAELAAIAQSRARCVGVFVDAPENVIEEVLETVALDALQFHGSETPEQVTAARQRFGLPVIRAIKLAASGDLDVAATFEAVADMLLFDAKPPPDLTTALPGGNAVSFDWRILADYRGKTPWALSGGLTAENLPRAVAITHARMVDVSSGVESAPGVKDPARIRAFLDAARALGE